jgi:Mn2+/Fe2+ NRAMP family transporter
MTIPGAGLARAVAAQVFRLANVGLAAGVIAGWVSFIGNHGDERAVGRHAAPWYWAVVVGLPVALAVLSWPRSATADGPAPPGVRARGAALLVAVALGAWVAGTILFLVAAILLPSVFGIRGLDPIAVRRALLDHVSWSAVILAGVLTVGAALVVAAQPLGKEKE